MKKLLALALLLCVAPPAPAATNATVTVKQVQDRRTKGSFSQLMISIEMPGIPSADVAASRVLVSQAVDDKGNNLVDSEAQEPELEQNARSMFGSDKKDSPVTVSVTLKNPDRKATNVKQISGEIELFMPSKDPNSVAEIPKFTSFSGKTLSHKALKANGVEIAPLNASQLAAEKKRLGDLKRKELKDAGYDDESINSVLASFLESLFQTDEGEVLVRLKDPDKHIQDVDYVDAAGEVKRISMRDEEGLTYFTTWGEKPQADWKLRVSMKTAKNIVRYPFSLTNVPLP